MRPPLQLDNPTVDNRT